MHSLPNLPPAVSREVFATLCTSLPLPSEDTPENRAERDDTAMAAVAALHPADAFEAKLAADIVAAEAMAMDCRRLAYQYRDDLAASLRCRAQANSTMREMRALLRELRRMQAARDKALNEMHPAAMERAGYWFRDVSVPAPEPAASPDSAKPPPFSRLTEAEQYATIYPDRAVRIRANRGLPARLDFGPPEPPIVEAIVTGTSPILRALDKQRGEVVPV
jgi:hypothetical protein